MIIIYGGTRKQVEQQLVCEHKNWHGPCIDNVSRYYKCLDCLCLGRDMTEKQYYDTIFNKMNEED